MESKTGEKPYDFSAPMRMSVLFPSFKLGGAELSQLNILGKLAKRGWSIDILTFHPDGPISRYIPTGMNLVGLKGRGKLEKVVSLAMWLRANKPPIAFAFEQRANGILMLGNACARTLNPRQPTRTVLCQRFPLSFKRSRSFPVQYLRCRIEDALYRQADRVIAISEGLREDLVLETGRPAERIHLIRNAKIDDDFMARCNEALAPDLHPWILEADDNSQDRALVVSCGVLEPRKNHAWLIDRFAAISSRTNARLIIVGEGVLRTSLEDKIRELGLQDRVALAGFIENPLPVFRVASLVAHCSIAEGLSNIFVEALACNTPVLGLARQQGISEVLEGGRWGRIVSDSPSEAFEAQLLEAIEHSRKDRRWLETQDKGLERFDAQKNIERYDLLLKDLLHAERR